jgi:hypothetical protein
MLTFKDFLVERVYRLSPTERSGVQSVVDRYLKLFNKDILKKFIILKIKPEDYYKKYLNEEGVLNIGYISFFDDSAKTQRELPVHVSFDKGSKDRGLYEYDEDEDGNITHERIILYYYKLRFIKNDIEDALVHELFHAKQPYKLPGKKYGNSLSEYYLDPVEIHNYTSNIVKLIEDEYNEGNIKDLLTSLKTFIQNPRPVTIPKFLRGKEEFITILIDNKDNPKYKEEYKRFFKKLYDTYKHLSVEV